jgi:hypothetical protein
VVVARRGVSYDVGSGVAVYSLHKIMGETRKGACVESELMRECEDEHLETLLKRHC